MRRKLVSIGLIFLLGCARGPGVSQDQSQVSGRAFSSDREAEIGRQIHQAIISSFRVYTEPRLVNYVTEIGNSIANAAGRRDLSYRFTVLYDERAYATEAPGGFVYLTTGFLHFLQNEAELAALLAHEVARLQLRDSRFSLMRGALGTLAQTGAVIGPFFGQIGVLAASAILLLNAFAESHDPSKEEALWKADRGALRYMVVSGYDPQGYLDLMSRYLNMDPEWMPYFYDYLTSRPLTVERYQQIIEEFEKLSLDGKSFSVNRSRYLEMTKGVREIYR